MSLVNLVIIIFSYLSRNFLQIYFTEYGPVLPRSVDAKTELFNSPHFRSYDTLSHSETVEPSNTVESILQLRKFGRS